MPDDPPTPPSDFDRYLAQVERDLVRPRIPPRLGLAERLLWIAIVGGGIALYAGAAWAVGRRMGWWYDRHAVEWTEVAMLRWMTKWLRRRPAQEIVGRDDDLRWSPDETWTPLLYRLPPADRLVIFMREEWDSPCVAKRTDLDPLLNIAGLFWRPWAGQTIDLVAVEASV